MRLDDVLQALRDGKSIRRQGWEGFSIRIMGLALYGNNNKPYALNLCDISAMDWEVVHKPKRVADFLVEGSVMVPGSERTLDE